MDAAQRTTPACAGRVVDLKLVEVKERTTPACAGRAFLICSSRGALPFLGIPQGGRRRE